MRNIGPHTSLLNDFMQGVLSKVSNILPCNTAIQIEHMYEGLLGLTIEGVNSKNLVSAF